jgi:hypothetical protein
MPRQQRVRRANAMKGRPITGEEFDRMLANVEAVVALEAAPSWKRQPNGLWHSGLRLGELSLFMGSRRCIDGQCLEVDMNGRRPMLRIPRKLRQTWSRANRARFCGVPTSDAGSRSNGAGYSN